MSYVVVVELQVDNKVSDRFADIMAKHRQNCLTQEPGCLDFEVARDLDDRGRFLVYEVYRDALAYQAHRRAASYVWFTEVGAPMIQIQPAGGRTSRRSDLTRADTSTEIASD